MHRRIRRQVAQLPDNAEIIGGAPGDRAARLLSGFDVARLYVTLQVKRDDYFPERLDDATFDLLVDLFLHEWFNRRVGAIHASALAVIPGDGQDEAIDNLARLSLAREEEEPGPAGERLVRLTNSGRARLNILFDYVANYLAAL